MICHFCQATAKRYGRYSLKKIQRYRCLQCGRTFSEQEKPLDEMRVSVEDFTRIIELLTEGVGINATARLSGVNKRTVLRCLELAGERCQAVLDSRIRDVRVEQIQADEIWSFVYCKQKHVKGDDSVTGDQYTWVALDRNTKLVLSYRIGKRSATNAYHFVRDLAERVHGRIQLTTDGFVPYVGAVEDAFGADVDFAQLIKIYAGDEANRERYSPSECIGAVPKVITGDPDPKMICTSHVERSNLSMRTFLRRMTRLCLGFSKKLVNLQHAVAVLRMV